MAFSLGDPRAQALSGAGQNFGSGLGNSLINFVENKNLGKALQGVNAQTPINEVLQKFAQYNVSPQAQDRFFSPMVQSRMQSAGAANYLQEALKSAKTPADMANAVLQAQAMTGQLGSVDKVLDYAMRGKLPGLMSQMGQGQQPSSKGAPTNVGTTAQPAMSDTSGMQMGERPPQQNINYFGVPTAGIGGEETRETVPTRPQILPPTPEQKQALRMQGFALGPQGEAMADQQINDLESAAQQSRREFEDARTLRQEQIGEQRNIEQEVEKLVNEEFAGNPEYRKDFKRYANYIAKNEAKGSPSERMQYATTKLNDIVNDLDAISNKIPSSDLLGSLDNPQKLETLEGLNVDSNRFLSRFPEQYKKTGYDALRTNLRSKFGMGPVSSEIAIKAPNPDVVSQIKSLPQAPEFPYDIFGAEPSKKSYGKDGIKTVNQMQKSLEGILRKALPSGESPIVLKDLVVNGLGYPDWAFDEVFRKVLKNVNVPSYNESAVRDAKKKFSTQYTGALDVFGGTSLLGPLEFSK